MPRASANVSISLYGSASQGWGFTPTTMTIPGPAITVAQFDSVTVRLEGMDAPRHNFFVDYNANNIPDASTEPVSPDFRNSTGFITYTFTADVAGVFTYYCDYHQSTMYGTLTVQPANTPPSAAISMPDGGRDWTGGTVHRIWWNMSDSQNPNTALRVFLNYSYNGGATRGSIAGPVPGTSGPNFYDWTVPSIDATDVVVNLTAVDSGGLRGWDEAAVSVVDSTGPSVVATVPASGAVNVPTTATVRMTWSEPMNTIASGSLASMGLQEIASGAWVQGAFSWNSPLNTVVTFDPTLILAPSTQYRAVANASARDDSDPGNALAAPYTWTFTTGTSADIQPPQISAVSVVPSVQNVGGTVNVSAVVTDNVGLAGVWLHVVSPTGDTNTTMTAGIGGTYFLNRTYGDVGVHAFSIWASDTSGLWSSTAGQFEIEDTEPPSIVHTPVASATLGVPLNVTATVTDNDVVVEVKLNWTDVTGRTSNVTMSSLGSSYWFVLPAQMRPGTLSYFLWAKDAAGNAARTPAADVQVRAPTGAILLYGDALAGWGFGPDNMTSPGPEIRVALGATVDLLLIGVDAARHNFFVDYSGDSSVAPGEPVSADFRGNTTRFSLVADRVGSFTYFCKYHIGTMSGTLVVFGGVVPSGGPPLLLWIVVSVVFAVAVAALVAWMALRRRRSPKGPGT